MTNPGGWVGVVWAWSIVTSKHPTSKDEAGPCKVDAGGNTELCSYGLCISKF